MRTTLDLDEDILSATREIARREGKTAGRVISDLVREALSAPRGLEGDSPGVLGFRPFPARGALITNEHIDQLREDGEA